MYITIVHVDQIGENKAQCHNYLVCGYYVLALLRVLQCDMCHAHWDFKAR
jgi:hypothetical protein